MEITYRKVGEYYLPNLIPPQMSNLGKYGTLRHDYLRKHRNGSYSAMLCNGKLGGILQQVDIDAHAMLETLMAQMAEAEGITEELKAEDQMVWVAEMENIRNRAEEIVLKEIVYA